MADRVCRGLDGRQQHAGDENFVLVGQDLLKEGADGGKAFHGEGEIPADPDGPGRTTGDGKGDAGHVVPETVRGGEEHRGVQYAADELARFKRGVRRQDVGQPFLAEKLAVPVRRFRDAVGIEQQAVPRFDGQGKCGVRVLFRKSEGQIRAFHRPADAEG